MSVEEIGNLHQTYIRLSDRFKSMWTFHQYLQGVHKALLGELPKSPTDFQKLYEKVRDVSTLLASSDSARVAVVIEKIQLELAQVSFELATIDRALSPSMLRRFFERVKTQDEKILYNLIKFYIYGGDSSPETLDKLDFLFTRMAERYDAVSAAFEMRQRGELIRLLEGFLQLRPNASPQRATEIDLSRARVAELSEAVNRAATFESLSEKGILDRIRGMKRSLGETYFHPQVLADTIELSITTKNRFRALYAEEERKIIESSRKVEEIEQGLAGDPRLELPEVQEELERYRRIKDAFDKGRESLNLKHEEITALKNSILDILSKFDRTLATEDEPASQSYILGAGSSLPSVFAPDPLLGEIVSRIVQTVELVEEGTATGRSMYTKKLVELRLEPWEISAVKKLVADVEPPDPSTGDLWRLYVSAAALRYMMDEQARSLLEGANVFKEKEKKDAFTASSRTLARAKEYDEKFQWFIEEALYTGLGQQLGELYRSKFRLMRCFSGLWLLFNKQSGIVPGL